MGMLYNYWMSHIVASVLLELIYLVEIVALFGRPKMP